MKLRRLFLLVLIFLFTFNSIHAYETGEASTAQTKLLLKLSSNLISVVTGNRTSFVANVENVYTQTIDSVKLSVQGTPSNWLEIIPKSINISTGDTQSYLVTIDVPTEAKADVYELTVKAKDEVESNTEILSLVVGKNLKEVADLLVKEFEDANVLAEKSLLVESCLDITVIKVIDGDAKYAYQRGLEEYEKENYTKAINYIEYAIPVEHNVVSRVDKSLEIELNAFKKSKIIIPPFYDSEEQFVQAQKYFEEKKYEEICKPIEKMRKYMMVGMIFWLAIVIIIIFLVTVSVILYRRKKIKERVGIIERVRERLGGPEEKI